MGITIHYRGTLDELSRVEELEDRVMDLVFALGGQATVWRSYADHDPRRVVRGLMVDMVPGHDTLSLLFSPEGHLTPLYQIGEAEQAPFAEQPYCFVKTQFGSVQGHIAIVHLLDALRQGYCSNLTVSDEGEYYETRDVGKLTEKLRFLKQAIDAMAKGLREHGLSHEAAEDPGIVASRIERVARLVQQKLLADIDSPGSVSNAAIDPEADFGNGWEDLSLEDEVAISDRHRREGVLRNERMNRRISEAMAAGMTIEEAFREAMREEGLEPPDGDALAFDEQVAAEDWLPDDDEAWRVSRVMDEVVTGEASSDFSHRQKHPAVRLAETFMLNVMALADNVDSADDFEAVACRGAGDMVGGLVQATSQALESRSERALAITQLKRALTGHAFARGAIFALRSADQLSKEDADRLHGQLATLLETIHDLTSEAWDEPAFE